MEKNFQNTNLQFGTQSKISNHTKQQNGTWRSKIRTMIFKNVRNNTNSKLYIKKVVTNTLHIFKKIEKIYKRENGRKGLEKL